MCIGNALLGGLAIPLRRFPIVLLQATAATLVHDPEVVLTGGKILRGRPAIPLHRLLVVLRQTSTIEVTEAEVVLGRCVSLST